MTDKHSWTSPTTSDIRELLEGARTVAVVGASDNPTRPSYDVSSYLVSQTDYEVWFVNPNLTTLLGKPVFPSLAALPEAPDLVDVFRRRSELANVAEQAVAAKAGTLWFQLGLYDEAVAGTATAAGLTVVMDRCLRVQHSWLIGPHR
ncbi:CoA-binding protein [Flexivirga oryzae]|uniref:CoA-binding domain-containing protein n=1 Tax=Flexivirga oryzae TaxID=1794944 RepID=A0A839NBY9_9MICO|nr:CoA-binding protein [Flexivirga oryzae]MBB2894727.1 hypothetical protein [Flexivirga oryzae]